jgi:hypothetical protein
VKGQEMEPVDTNIYEVVVRAMSRMGTEHDTTVYVLTEDLSNIEQVKDVVKNYGEKFFMSCDISSILLLDGLLYDARHTEP